MHWYKFSFSKNVGYMSVCTSLSPLVFSCAVSFHAVGPWRSATKGRSPRLLYGGYQKCYRLWSAFDVIADVLAHHLHCYRW